MNRLQEQFILWQIRKGKTEAFAAIYDEYNRAIHRYLQARLPRPDDADDLTSQVFLDCFAYIKDPGRPGIEQVRAFLYHLARTATAKYYQNRPKREVSVADPSVHESLPEGPLQPDMEAGEDEYHERRQAHARLLEQSLMDVKPEYREVILMRYTDGMSMEQIAETLNKSEGTVRVLLHRARESLKKCVKR